MKHFTTYIVACLWCWATLIPLNAQGLKSFLSGGVASVSTGPISYVGAATNGFSATRSPVVNYPAVSANDIIMVVFATDTVASFNGTPPSGWTLLHEESGSGGTDTSGGIFWKRAGGSETSDTWTNITAATEDGIAVAVAFRNCKTSGSPFNVSGTPIAGGSVTGHNCPSVTTTVDDCMVIGILCIDPGASTRTYTWDAGFDERVGYATTPSGVNSTLGGVYIGTDIVETAGSSTPGGDFNAAEDAAKFTYALEPQ